MSRLSNAALTAALLEIKPVTWHLCAENERRVRSAPACGLLETPAVLTTTSSNAQGGGGSFKNRKPIGEFGCCESRRAERSH